MPVGPQRDQLGYILVAPSSAYPMPFACLIGEGGPIHFWTNSTDQPLSSSNPPSYTKGWNHVEVGPDGFLYVTVPLRSVLKLGPDSSVIWKANVSAHHDLAFDPAGNVYVLTEEPRRVEWGGGSRIILDDTVTVLGPNGERIVAHSVFDILATNPTIRSLIEVVMRKRRDQFGLVDALAIDTERDDAIDATLTSALNGVDLSELESDRHADLKRHVLCTLRDMPGSPSSVLHANTIEILGDHPHGCWHRGNVLISLRNLNLIAVLDLQKASVVWAWGPGVLEGQHQPSALPNGNVLVFDNGSTRGWSRVLEINPSTNEIVWWYVGNPREALFSEVAGGCEMLPGGEIAITDAQSGTVIVVNRGGKIVGGAHVDRLDSDGIATSRVAVYRISRVSPEAVAVGRLGCDEAEAMRLSSDRGLRCVRLPPSVEVRISDAGDKTVS